MRNLLQMILSVGIVFSVLFSFSFAIQGASRWYDDPMSTLESMVDDANGGQYKIQDTALDGVTDAQGGYSRQYKISNTLDYFRMNIDPYLQWAVYIGLVLATIALIYMGFLLVTGALHKTGDIKSLKQNLVNLVIGVLLLSGFYVIVKIIVALVNTIFV